MPTYNTMQFAAQPSSDTDYETATTGIRARLTQAGFDPYEGTPGAVRGTVFLTPPGFVLWAVVEEIDAPDADAALADLSARLTQAGFRLHANPRSLLFDGCELAFLSENQPGQADDPEQEGS